MNRNLFARSFVLSLSLLVSFNAFAEDKKEDAPKSFNDMPVIKFAIPKSAKIKTNREDTKEEVMKFSVGYDENKIVEEIKTTQASKGRFPSHKFIATPNFHSFAATYDYKGTRLNPTTALSTYNVDKQVYGFEGVYQYQPNEKYILEISSNYYTGGMGKTTKTVATGKTIRFADSEDTFSDKSASVQTFVRNNYCLYTFSDGTRLCPGLDVIYDSFPMLNTTETSSTVVNVDMRRTTELSAGANLYSDISFYNDFLARLRLGYLTGTGAFRTGVETAKNSAIYMNADVDWKLFDNHSVTFGVAYLKRSITTANAEVAQTSTFGSIGYIYEIKD